MEYTVGAGLPAGVTDALMAGQCFWYNTPGTATTATAAVNANSSPMIWNPSSSNRMLHVIQINVGAISGAVIASHGAYGYLLAAGDQQGTAQPILLAGTTLTPATVFNALPGAGVASRMRYASTTIAMTTGPAYMAPNGFSAGGALAAGAASDIQDMVWGKIVVPPGVAFFPWVSNAAMALVASVSVFGWEQVINPNGP